MKVVLTSVEQDLTDAWKSICGDLPGVDVHHGSIFAVECDAVVSPANSFGYMDGGIDLLYSLYFGWDVQDRLQNLIRTKHHGELVVGTADIVETGNPEILFLIAAPTMRVPMTLHNSINPYLAARAALLLAKHGRFSEGSRAGEPIADSVHIVAFPGLGTGVGQVTPELCAFQVRAAIEEVLLDKPAFPSSWREASLKHQKLIMGVR